MVKRSYYSNDIQSFLNQDKYSIFGEITTNDQFPGGLTKEYLE